MSGNGKGSSPSEERDRILGSLLAGESGMDDPTVRKFLDDNPELRGEVEAVFEVRGLVDEASAFQRDVLADAEGLHDAPGSNEVERVIRDQIARGPTTPRTSGGRWKIWLPLAAAAGLLAFAFLYDPAPVTEGPGNGPSRDGILGSEVQVVSPMPGGGDYVFEVDRGTIPVGALVEFVVYAKGEEDPILRSGERMETRWELTGLQQEELGDGIEFTVRVVRETGDVTTTARFEASR